MNEFGNYLYTLRKARGFTQAELADRLGVTNKAVSKWETGEAFPETALLLPLANVFGVTVDELLRGGGKPETAAEEDGVQEETAVDARDGAVQNAESADTNGALAPPKAGGEQFRPDWWPRRFAALIATGVAIAAAGIIALMIVGALTENEEVFVPVLCGMLACFVLATDIFIFAGIRNERYFLPVKYGDWQARVRSFTQKMVAGMSLCGAGIICFVLSGMFVAGGISQNTAVFVCLLAFGFAFLAAGAFFFIYGGVVWNEYVKKVVSQQFVREEEPVVAELMREGREKESLSGRLCGVVMLLATAVFLVLGIVWGLWHPGWLSFVVGGLICGIIGVVCGDKEK